MQEESADLEAFLGQNREGLWSVLDREHAMAGRTYMYGPGRSFIALKQRHVSSTKTGPCI